MYHLKKSPKKIINSSARAFWYSVVFRWKRIWRNDFSGEKRKCVAWNYFRTMEQIGSFSYKFHRQLMTFVLTLIMENFFFLHNWLNSSTRRLLQFYMYFLLLHFELFFNSLVIDTMYKCGFYFSISSCGWWLVVFDMAAFYVDISFF